MAGNVVRISKVVIRLNEPCLQAAQSVASLAGVNLSELVEILLLGLVDEGAVLDPGLRHVQEAAAEAAPPVHRHGRPAKVLSMEEARARRHAAAVPVTPLLQTSQTLCERAARARERAQAASTRAMAARESAERARGRAAQAIRRAHGVLSGAGSA